MSWGSVCDECRKTRLGLQRKEVGQRNGAGIPSIVEQVLRSPGQPLDASTGAVMGHRFGHDFSHVQVHADERAGISAHALNALAYTAGSHVVFGAGRYAPHSTDGRRLLAHELTHVVQQSVGEVGDTNRTRDEAEADQVAEAVTGGRTLPPISASGVGLRKQDAPKTSTEEAEAFRAELSCDLPALCRLHFSNPRIVDVARVTRVYRSCAPSRLPTGLDPCLSVSALPSTTATTGPLAQPGPTAAPSAPQTGAGGAGIHLPSTKLKFQLGDVNVEMDLPSSLTATLPVNYRHAQIIAFKLEAKTSGDFSLEITINAVPHVRIALRAGVKVGSTPQGSAGLVIEATDTVCHAEDPLTARDKLNKAGKKLHDAVQAAQKSAQPDKLADVVAAIVGVQSEVDAAKAKCKQVTRARLEFGAHTPLGPFSPHMPPTASDLGTAPYVGGTLTIPFD